MVRKYLTLFHLTNKVIAPICGENSEIIVSLVKDMILNLKKFALKL